MKCQYVKNQGLSGVMIWELSQDVIGQSQPLLDIVGTQMITTGVAPEVRLGVLAAAFFLYDNYPNPFNPSTTIQFNLPVAAHVSIRVFDVLGRDVALLIDEYRSAGVGAIRFDASQYNLSSGVYYYRLQAGAFEQTKKMILMK